MLSVAFEYDEDIRKKRKLLNDSQRSWSEDCSKITAKILERKLLVFSLLFAKENTPEDSRRYWKEIG